MKKVLISAIMVVTCVVALSAASTKQKKIKIEKPDMAQIEQMVNDPDSKYYYPKLMAKYERRDTLMQHDEYRLLYYGYMFQEDFDPYRRSDYSDIVDDLYYRSEHSRSECDSIIKYAELSLCDNPFDLQQINFLIYALREKKKNHLANIWQYRLNHLIQAIVSSGTGLDKDNAWYVINPRHEYNMINFKGYVADSQEFMPPYYDYITIEKKNDKDPAGFYFNIKNLLDEYYRKHPESVDE